MNDNAYFLLTLEGMPAITRECLTQTRPLRKCTIMPTTFENLDSVDHAIMSALDHHEAIAVVRRPTCPFEPCGRRQASSLPWSR